MFFDSDFDPVTQAGSDLLAELDLDVGDRLYGAIRCSP